jgi:hypothetical protein
MATTGPSLYPSATTFPNTNVYPGQGSYPFVRFLYATDDLSVLSPTWIDGTSKLRTFNVSRGRDSEMSQFSTGTLTAELDNRTRSFDPTGGSYGTVTYGTTVYGQAQVAPMNRVRLYAEYAGATYDLFNGYAEAWQQSWPDPGTSDAVASLTAADEMKVIGLAQLPQSGTIPDGWNIDQVNFILDQINNRAPRRTYREVGVVTDTASRDMTGQDPLTEINASVDTAITHGTAYAFFVSADGYVTFVPHFSAGPTTNFYATSFYIFDEYPAGGTERGYLDVTTDFSDAFLTNQWTVTRPGGTDQTASDPASISRYGLRAQSKSIPFQTDAHSLAAAQLLVTKYATPLTRVTSLVPNMSDGDTAAAVFDLDLFEQLDVHRTPPGGAEVTQIVRVQKIELSGEAGTAPEGVVVGCRYGLAAR